LRRGARAEAIGGSRTEKEQVVAAMAENLANVPSSLTTADVEAVQRYFSKSETEWLVYSISMMGFLTKFMNTMGIELEQEAINDTAELLSETGWQPGIHALNGFTITKYSLPQRDNLFTYLRVIRQAPGAVKWEKKWTGDVPSEYDAASEFLKQHAGYSFPILKPIKEKRVIRTLTTALKDNLDEAATVTGLKIKMYAGCIFSTQVSNNILKSEIRNLAVNWAPGLNNEKFALLDEASQIEIPFYNASCESAIESLQQQLSLTQKEAAIILLTISASYSPAQNNDAVNATALKYLEPAEIVEIVVWLSILQLLNRLSSYYMVMKAY
jgi:hypothetical protein